MKWVMLLALWTTTALAHKLEQSFQYWWLKGPQKKSFQYNLAGSIDLNLSESLLLGATHFERFQEVDQQVFLGWRKKWLNTTLELSARDGGGNEILSRREAYLTLAHGLSQGYSLWGTLRTQNFKSNDVNLATLGLEKEWSGGIFAVASLTGGRATYHSIADTADVWGSQLRLGQYREDAWKFWGFIARGEEAQALANLNQSAPLQVVSFGAGAEMTLKKLQLGLQLERSYYRTIQTRFESALLYLNYAWGKQ